MATCSNLSSGTKVFSDELAQMIGVIGGIRHHMPDARQPFNKAARLRAITPLPWGDDKGDWQVKRIHRGMDFRGQAAFGATDCVNFSPPFAQLASAWALQIVASTRTYSKSGSVLKAPRSGH